MKQMRISFFLALLAGGLLAACSPEEWSGSGAQGGTLTVRLASAGFGPQDGDAAGAGGADASGESGESGESALYGIQAFRFADGVLREVSGDLAVPADGVLTLSLSQWAGTLYFWANASEIADRAAFVPGETTLEEFLDCQATAAEMSTRGLAMTASVDLSRTGPEVSLQLRRSVARIDLQSEFSGVAVRKVTLGRLAGTGYVNERSGAPAAAAESELVRDYGDRLFSGGTERLGYLCEQPGGRCEITAEVQVNGAWRVMQTELESVVRNTVYTLRIYGNGAELGISVDEGEWESGTDASSGLVPKGRVDVEASEFISGIRVSEGRDTVFLSYRGSRGVLALQAENGTEAVVKGSVDGVTVSRRNGTKTLLPLASFEVSGVRRYPGKGREYLYLDMLSGNTLIGRVVVAVEPNPVELTGKIVLDGNGVCDFDRYVDGELGVLTVPAGRTAALRFPAGEKEWARLVPLSERSWRIEGGWKPNDPEADGRTQRAEIVVADADGGNEEAYAVSRQNWGLPVVNINGTWWCKYNLRGNVKRFEDQISIAADPAASDALAEYLQQCSDEEFLRIAGDQYQAGRPEGLKLEAGESGPVYAGYNPAHTTDFGNTDPESMAPDGYRVPGYSDYRFFAWGDNCNLGYGANAFNNQLGQRLTYTVSARNLTAAGAEYGPVHIYDFVCEGRHWVLVGLGHQYNATEIARMSILFATGGQPGRSWMMEGYAQGDGRGNWIKYAPQNASKTRMIRCVKTPVDYIYE